VAEQLLGGQSRGTGWIGLVGGDLPLVDGDEDIMMKIVIFQHERSEDLYWVVDWWVGMKTDGKPLFLLPFLYFLAETGAGSENAGSKTESEYVGSTETDKYGWRAGKLN
jgi:hypothetical protein